jgi:hypothetical protein
VSSRLGGPRKGRIIDMSWLLLSGRSKSQNSRGKRRRLITNERSRWASVLGDEENKT